ncbi:hypothetical protein L195_g048913 [Trifolium pratense]|uniref:RNase H type-1 domain-containing protein n=1 Tax=Trifolium pratense TaxID=57577 RepID=A0A2K3JMM3_TRIPR|nr:hypothetical protein L195_g048913 [Trifolium pratense]
MESSCVAIFRNNSANMICCFAQNTSLDFAFHAEFCGAMYAIEIEHRLNWHNLWIETDSILVVKALGTGGPSTATA